MFYYLFSIFVILGTIIYCYKNYRGELIYKFEAVDILFCDKVKYLFNHKSYETYKLNSIAIICLVALLALKYMSNDIILQVYFIGLLSIALLRLLKALKIKNKVHIYNDRLQYSNITIGFQNIDSLVINFFNIEIMMKDHTEYIFKIINKSDIEKVRDILNIKNGKDKS